MKFQYCPHCGNKLIKKEIGDEGFIPFCENCDVPLWDMFTTSIIAAVVNEQDEVALLRQNYVSETKHVCVAGIMKIGESAEDSVVREIAEEIGLTVKKQMLMLGYKAVVDKEDFTLSGEVDSAVWIKFDEALSLLREGSIAWQLVKEVIQR